MLSRQECTLPPFLFNAVLELVYKNENNNKYTCERKE